MPVNIPDKLPAIKVLQKENIFVMDASHASKQDIRPLKIAVLNLMPIKITTETDLIRLLSNSPLQVELDFISLSTHISKNTPKEHMQAFYKNFKLIIHNKYDGLIITGAPVEQMPFEEVAYWKELTEILSWAKSNVTSSIFICWGAQAALYHYYGIPKYPLEKKMFGVFSHTKNDSMNPILRGFDDVFYVPHSRHTEIRREDILKVPELTILSESKESGVYMVASKNGREFFLTGHSEYSPDTLDIEYKRDLEKKLPIEMPKNYYVDDNPNNPPFVRWRSQANMLFVNWLNYFVYQKTPYNIEAIK
ncbi:MAG TPA: homoserine O-succinyltransferase [Bacteroidales bacterium]